MKKNWKTTLIALVNLIALCMLLVLLSLEKISAGDFLLVLSGVNSAVVTILGFFAADGHFKKPTP